jgi:hypothetical protein
MVTQNDLSRPADTLTKQLTSAIQTMVSSQIQPGESLVTPLSCTPQTSTDHKEGEEAKTVVVTIHQTCTAIAYNAQTLQAHILPVFSQNVAKQLPGYSVTGELEISKIGVTSNKQQLSCSVQVNGNCQYLFIQNNLHQIQELVKGKSKDEALVLLLHYPGIQSVGISLSGFIATLPNDPENIHTSIVSMP